MKYLAILVVALMAVTCSSASESHSQLNHAAKLLAELDTLADSNEEVASYIRQSFTSMFGGVFLQTEAMTMTGTGRHTATSYAECIEAWIDETPVHVHNKCQDARKVTIECQHKVDECVIGPESTERCGECGAPDINKDEFKVTKSGGN